jgi:hypothetical protein
MIMWLDFQLTNTGIDELSNIHVNQPFKINGFLKNNSNHSWEIFHGAGMFSYQIYDENGNPIPREGELFVNGIGMRKSLKSHEVYRNNGEEQRSREFYEFTINNAGNYKVRTIVKFRINHDQAYYEQEITSDFYEFSVK